MTSTLPQAPVTVGVDGSPAAVDAAWAALGEAVRRELPLRVVRAFDWPAGGLRGARTGAAGREVARASAGRDLSRLRQALAAAAPPATVTGVLVDGLVDLVLHDEARTASLLVVGCSGLSWTVGPGPGSVALRALRSSPAPVLVHRPATGALGRRGVVAGVDAPAVLLAAAEEAVLLGVPLAVLPVGPHADEVTAQVARLRREVPALRVELLAAEGAPAARLVQCARGADLLVVGRPPTAPGRGPGAGFSAVVGRAPCPVLVVPPAVPYVEAPVAPPAGDAAPGPLLAG